MALAMPYVIWCSQLRHKPTQGPAGERQADDVGVMFSEIFMKDHGNVGLLLAVLEEPAPRLQLFTIQVLTELARNVPQKLQVRLHPPPPPPPPPPPRFIRTPTVKSYRRVLLAHEMVLSHRSCGGAVSQTSAKHIEL
jgi:hypothetical protein